MKPVLIAAALAALVSAGPSAMAQTQSGSQPTQTDNNSDAAGNKSDEAMKQCMARQRATNSGLTDRQMKTTCKNEMKGDKTRKEGNDLATGPQSGDKPPPQ